MRNRGVQGYEDGGVFPLAPFYRKSEVGASDHRLPESMPVELPEAQAADDSASNGVFDEGVHNLHADLGVFADNAALPGYAQRENGFGPSETIDWQLQTPVQVFQSGIYNVIADAGLFPNARGSQYWPQSRRMADTDFRQDLPEVDIANRSGVVAQRVLGSRATTAQLERTPQVPQSDPSAPVSGYRGFGAPAYLQPAIANAIMSRRLLQVAKPGVVDIVARRGGYPNGHAYSGVGLGDAAGMPTWQWGALGVAAGAVLGTLAAFAFPKRR